MGIQVTSRQRRSKSTDRWTRSSGNANQKVKLKGLDARARKAIDTFKNNLEFELIVPWIEKYMYDHTTVINYQGVWDYEKAKRLKLNQYQKDILNHVLTPDEDGYFPYNDVIWSEPKKHGKTQIAACVMAWWGCKIEYPNVIMTMASNQEQSAGLIFYSGVPSIQALGAKVPTSTTSKPLINLPNGTLIQAIPNNYAGQAGGNQGLVLWSELWTYHTENERRLYDEMPDVPTRKNSISWVDTYAGFEDESSLLKEIYLRVFQNTEGKDLTKKAEPVLELKHLVNDDGSYQCYHIKDEGLFMFWSHKIQAPWITKKYLKRQKARNRTTTYIRLWKNEWQSSLGTYLDPPSMIDDAITLDGQAMEPMVLAGDGSQRNDTTALVGTSWKRLMMFGKPQERHKCCYVKIYDPKKHGVQFDDKEMLNLGAKKGDLHLSKTIALDVYRIWQAGLLIGPWWYDPTQLHDVAMNLRELGVPCVEFPQGAERLKADTYLWELFNEGRIDLFPSGLIGHLKSASAKEYENEQVRIIKGEASGPKKVDSAVALSMSCWASAKMPKGKIRQLYSTSNSLWDGYGGERYQ